MPSVDQLANELRLNEVMAPFISSAAGLDVSLDQGINSYLKTA